MSEKLFDQSTKCLSDILSIENKIGKGSYGSVYKAVQKSTEPALTFALKQIPIETESDLDDIIKEISIMKQLNDSPFIVKYFASYFKNSDLWIVMEYCMAGSASDIMKLTETTFHEDQIATILNDTLKGLEYLHMKKKIHRDIKAGNILLDLYGNAKLADFGVAGQLSDTMSKRNTVIGTPYWMAPEIIQETGYDCTADIWSLGITAIELADGRPPFAEIHPMRAIFMIPTKPSAQVRHPQMFSNEFNEFVAKCLVKDPHQRVNSSDLLQNDSFIKKAKPSTILCDIIDLAIRERNRLQKENSETEDYDKTLYQTVNTDQYTIRISDNKKKSTITKQIDHNQSATFSTCKTLVINDSTSKSVGDESECDMTMVINYDTTAGTSDSEMRGEESILLKGVGDEHEQLGRLVRKEAAGFGKEITECELGKLTKEEIDMRLSVLDKEMENELNGLKVKFSKNKEKILSAIMVKKKNCHSQIF